MNKYWVFFFLRKMISGMGIRVLVFVFFIDLVFVIWVFLGSIKGGIVLGF